MSVLIETSIGNFVVDLYLKERPKTCLNFLKLCKTHYYNNCLFHCVQRNNVAQSGDPTGTGRGGGSVFSLMYGEQAKYFPVESSPIIKHTKPGLLSMVGNSQKQHGSQFFLTLDENLFYLDKVHSVFGEIAEGKEIIDKFNNSYVDKQQRPYRNIRIHHTILLFDPFEDDRLLSITSSPIYVPNIQLCMESNDEVRLEEDEVVNDHEGLTDQQIMELEEKNKAKSNAKLLKILGDIPDEDAKPPDNVLFVCKLNPITTDEDLQIIFSRFGEIISCEVIRDKRTGSSLQYAFIEFEKPESVENAIFKMENVVIDDRRIHVDFSQSVSKIWNSYKHTDNKLSTKRLNPRKGDKRQAASENDYGLNSKYPRSSNEQSKGAEDKNADIYDKLINMIKDQKKDSKYSDSSSSSDSDASSHKKKKKKCCVLCFGTGLTRVLGHGQGRCVKKVVYFKTGNRAARIQGFKHWG